MPNPPFDLCIVGDLQETSYWEFWRERNDTERNLILDKIRHLQPRNCILLGDMVLRANSQACWRPVDKFLSFCRSHYIRVYPVLGNHEYWGDKKLTAYGYRFGHVLKSAYTFDMVGSENNIKIGAIVLNSNKSEMGLPLWEIQLQWYRSQLEKYDTDERIKGILVFCHHPPFTNSNLRTGSSMVFADIFLNSTKTLALIAGHVHSYERFNIKGKTFIVSGGGGGPRRPVFDNSDLVDQYTGDTLRPFHFIGLRINDEGLTLRILGLDKGELIFRNLEKVTLPYHESLSSL